MVPSQLSVNPQEALLYRSAKALPVELQEQCAIYLEEGLYSQSLTLLTSLLISGTSCSPGNHLIAAYVPPSSFISFLATFIVHPSTTTRAKSDDGLGAPNQALHYLQNLCRIVGPLNARLTTAFAFNSSSGSRSRTSLGKRRRDDESREADNHNEQVLNTKLAQEQSIWTRGESFWHVVGWAFNCATLSQARWQRWKLWLELMLDVLEADLAERTSKSKAAESTEEKGDLIRKSLVVQFVTGIEGSITQHGRRRAMRAVFAHGSARDVAEFKEIWKDETKERVIKDEKIRPKIDEQRQGLAFLESDDEDEVDGMNLDLTEIKAEDPGSARQTRRTIRNIKPVEDSDSMEETSVEDMIGAVDSYGGLEAVCLRRRLLRLLCTLCDVSTSFANTDVLLDLFSEFCRPLPLPLFSIIIMPTGSNALPKIFNSSLCKELFRPLLSVAAPRFDTNYVTQEDMESRYLAATANSSTVWDNAKVSLLMEALLWLLRDSDTLKYSVRLEDAVTKGIQARRDKVKKLKGGKLGKKQADAEEAEQGLDLLEASSKRLAVLVSLLQA